MDKSPLVVGKLHNVEKPIQFQWVLENFTSYLNDTEVGIEIESPILGDNWKISIYPGGKDKTSKDYVAIFLNSMNKRKITVHYMFYIVNDLGKKVLIFEELKRTFKANGYGDDKAIKSSKLLDPSEHLMLNDTLKILCEINSGDNASCLDAVNKEFECLECFEPMLNSESFSDVKIEVKHGNESKTIHAHKVILSSRSPVFGAMFANNMKENRDNTVQIEGIAYDVLLELIRYIYSGKVTDIEAIAEELLIAADRYALDDLKMWCERILEENICLANMIEYLKLADSCNASYLKKSTLNQIVNHAKYIVSLAEMENLTKSHPHLSLEITREIATMIPDSSDDDYEDEKDDTDEEIS